MKRSPIRRKPRPSMSEESAWYKRIHDEIPCCVLCGKHGVTVAHRNEGRGMGQKAPFSQTAALCWPCHYRIDNGRDLSQGERRALMDEAIKRTQQLLGWSDGLS